MSCPDGQWYSLDRHGLTAWHGVCYAGGMASSPIHADWQFDLDTSDFSDEQTLKAGELCDWMVGLFTDLIKRAVPKAIAYGSADLELMGSAMYQFHPELVGVVSGQELAIWFYVLGKVARLTGGYAQGARPDIDSWEDLLVYAAMAKRVRERGAW